MKSRRLPNAWLTSVNEPECGQVATQASDANSNMGSDRIHSNPLGSVASLRTRELTELPELVTAPVSFRRTIRRSELRMVVPLSDSTIYEMERRGEFPQRFHLTERCVVWDLQEIEAWLETRRARATAMEANTYLRPDVRQRKRRPVKQERTSD